VGRTGRHKNAEPVFWPRTVHLDWVVTPPLSSRSLRVLLQVACVVFGMPAEAIKLGAVDRVLPLESIASEVVRACR